MTKPDFGKKIYGPNMVSIYIRLNSLVLYTSLMALGSLSVVQATALSREVWPTLFL